jgi:flagellar protein FliJ
MTKERLTGVDKQAVTGPSFRFRLERVRVVRARKEKLAQQQLARSISQLASSEAQLRSSETHLEQARAEQRSAAGESRTVRAEELIARQAFIERIEAQRAEDAIRLTRSEADVADRNAELTVAATEHEMLNRLRERRRGEHDREAARKETTTLDEIAVARFRRKIA